MFIYGIDRSVGLYGMKGGLVILGSVHDQHLFVGFLNMRRGDEGRGRGGKGKGSVSNIRKNRYHHGLVDGFIRTFWWVSTPACGDWWGIPNVQQ